MTQTENNPKQPAPQTNQPPGNEAKKSKILPYLKMAPEALGIGVVAGVVLTLLIVILAILPPYLKQQPGLLDAAKLMKSLGPVADYVGGVLNPFIALSALLALVVSVHTQRDTLTATREGMQSQLEQQYFFTLLGNREAAIASLELVKKKGEDGLPEVFRGRAVIREVLRHVEAQTKKIADQWKLPDEQRIVAAASSTGWTIEKITEVNERFEVGLFASKPPDAGEKTTECCSLSNHSRIRIALFVILFTGSVDERTWKNCTAKEEINSELDVFQNKYDIDNLEEIFGHIFRSTYHVLKFVKNSKLEDTQSLVNYLRAQMSEAEYAAFALTSLTSIGVKSRVLAKHFDLYQNRLLSTPSMLNIAEFLRREKISDELIKKLAESDAAA